MYKIHKDGWSAATKEDLEDFTIEATEAQATAIEIYKNGK